MAVKVRSKIGLAGKWPEVLLLIAAAVVGHGIVHEMALYSGFLSGFSNPGECDTALLIMLDPVEIGSLQEDGVLANIVGGECVRVIEVFDEFVESITSGQGRLILIAHFFEATGHSPGGIGLPRPFGITGTLSHPIASLTSYRGEANSLEYQVLPPRLIGMLSIDPNVEVMLIVCALPGIEETVRAFKRAGAHRVYWTSVAELGIEEAFTIARKMLETPDWKTVCDNSSLIECL